MTDDSRPTEPFGTPASSMPASAAGSSALDGAQSVPPSGASQPAAPQGSPPATGSWNTAGAFAPVPAAQPPFGAAPAPAAAGTPVGSVVVNAPRKRSTASTLVNVLLGIAVVVAVGGGAFAAGRATAPAATTGGGRFGANGQIFGGNGGFRPKASGAPGRRAWGGGLRAGGLSM